MLHNACQIFEGIGGGYKINQNKVIINPNSFSVCTMPPFGCFYLNIFISREVRPTFEIVDKSVRCQSDVPKSLVVFPVVIF